MMTWQTQKGNLEQAAYSLKLVCQSLQQTQQHATLVKVARMGQAISRMCYNKGTIGSKQFDKFLK